MLRRLGLLAVIVFSVAGAGYGLAVAATRHHHSTGATLSTGSDPVLLGDQNVEQIADGGKGTSEAFGYTASVTGTVTDAKVYLTSTDGVAIGVYSDSNSKPHTLLDKGSVASNSKGWVTVPLSGGVQVTAGVRYWIAIYAGSSAATVTYRDSGSGGSRLDYSGSGLPATYNTTARWGSNPASVFLDGTTSGGGGSTSTTTSSTTTTPTTSTTSSTQTTTTSQTTQTTTTSSTTTTPPPPPPSGTDCAGAPGAGKPDYAAMDACGFPSPNTTGIPAGTTLTPIAQANLPAGASWSNGELDISGNNVTVSGVSITNGQVHITGVNDQLNNSLITGGGNPEVLIYNGASNTVMNHDEVEAPTSTIGAINNAGGTPFLLTNSYLHNNCTGLLGTNVTARDNYMITDGNVPGCHVEDGYVPGGDTTPTVYEHNTLLNPLGQTAAVFLDDHAFGTNHNVTLDDNLWAGGGYCTYGDNGSDGATNIVITNNRFSRIYYPDCGYYGPDALNLKATTWTGNVWDDSLQPVPANAG